ncbi:ankyrin repeat-containing protein [Anaeramoeba ignava]|uniref:Ankyrin repeat-containing protein n=1 Tax=Anaeramoeba ignava TaxID=1746090 RepID=A0A9Q0RFR2_ANAIG|nr:ankyrin repeat-containing protein [Anaeramoeba ignava]
MESNQIFSKKLDFNFDFIQFCLSLNQNDLQKTLLFISNQEKSQKLKELVNSFQIKENENENEIIVQNIEESIENKNVIQVSKYMEILENLNKFQLFVDEFELNSLLHFACLKNSGLEIIKLLIENGANINFTNFHKQNTLHIACQNGNSPDVIQFILENKPRINKDAFNCTPLIYALSKNPNHQVIELLLKFGENLKIKFQKMSLLFYAIKNRADSKTLQVLVNYGADLKEIFSDKTAIDFAILNQNSLEVIQFLHKNGVDIKRKSKANYNCLHFFILKKLESKEICQFLISQGIDVLDPINPPLETALEKGVDENILGIMLSKVTKEKMNEFTEKKKPNIFLNLALSFSTKYEIIQLLIQLGCPINGVDKKWKTPLHLALENGADFQKIQLLINSGASINFQSKSRNHLCNSILSTAITSFRDLDIINLVIDSGAEILDQDMVIAFQKNYPVFLYLSKINPNFSFEKNLWDLINRNSNLNDEKIKFVVDHMKDVNHKTTNQENILHLLCQLPPVSPQIFEYVILKGVDLNSLNLYSRAPFYNLFTYYNSDQIIEILPIFLHFGMDLNYYIRNMNSFLSDLTQSCLDYKCWKLILPKLDVVDPLDEILISPFDHEVFYLKTLSSVCYSSVDLDKTLKIVDVFQAYTSFCDDFMKLFKLQFLTDLEITFLDGDFVKIHKLILSARIGEDRIERFIEFCAKKTQRDLKFLFQWIYSGSFFDLEYEKLLFDDFEKFCEEKKQFVYEINEKHDEVMQSISDERKNNFNSVLNSLIEMGIIKNQEELFGKSKVDGLRKDIQKLFYQDESKDFSIISEKEEVKAHKIILAARSYLFYGMFLNVDDDSNRVNDYSGKSKKSIEQIVKFLYFDRIDQNIQEKNIEELEDADKYYQFNEKSIFPLLLEGFKMVQQKKIL